MKDLSSVSRQEQEEFFKSFDHVLCDVDGVLWILQDPIPGAVAAIKSLKTLGKKVAMVSNNSTRTHDDYYNQLKSAGFEIEKSKLIIPILAMVEFLKKRNFSKEIYLIGMTPLRSQLENAGFKIAENAPDSIEESVPLFVKMSLARNEKVGAVIADLDLNMTVLRLQKGATYLKDPEVLFITGGKDVRLHVGPDQILIGPGCFHEILEDMVGREPVSLAKPSVHYNDFIKDKLNISDSSRVLFIGDSVESDMSFAANCGYKKLLVLSGLTPRESVGKWEFPEEYKPDYYVDSLQNIQDILTQT